MSMTEDGVAAVTCLKVNVRRREKCWLVLHPYVRIHLFDERCLSTDVTLGKPEGARSSNIEESRGIPRVPQCTCTKARRDYSPNTGGIGCEGESIMISRDIYIYQ